MSQIFLDVTRLLTRLRAGQHPTGVDRVGLAYVENYCSRARAVLSERGFSVVLSAQDSRRLFEQLVSGSARPPALPALVLRACASGAGLGKMPGILLHTSHNGMEYPRYYTAMKRRGIRSVFMVHDLIPLTHAEYCRPGVEATHRVRIHTAFKHADGLIANSQATFDSIVDEAQRSGLPSPPCTVAPLAPGPIPRRGAPRPLDARYFVMLGTIEPRKNHWLILHVWRRLVEQFGNAAPKLVIIGRRGWECENVVDMLERSRPLRDAVIEESNCPDERLSAWLEHAQALLFPSFVEGYGMPLIEALDQRIPVLASDLPVFHEIAGDLPDYLDPLDGMGWFERILAYAGLDSTERATQLARLGQFRAPTWADHFTRVDAFLASLT
ncbi:glycosyltransferase family 4 protein [Burkholderia theae]|uniref:glycosyltransferase family 4 protein n=1 Tax=Burkholderia theae TaxID=3143496 RepID=UPI003AFA6914